jgi:hypothetical protein
MRLCALLWQKPGRKGPNAKGSKAPAQATQFLHHLHVLLLLPIVLYGALIIIQSDSRYQSVYSYRTALIGATIRETFAASARRGTCCSTQPRPSAAPVLADACAATGLAGAAPPPVLAEVTPPHSLLAVAAPPPVLADAAAAAFLALFAPPAMGTGRGYDDRSNRVSGCPS